MRDYHFVIKDGCADGILPDGTHFLIDVDMIPTVEKYGFHLNHKGYPYVPKFVTKTNNIFLHWLVLGYTERPEFQVDHINRIKTDCRRCNLRPVTNQQNTMNRKLNKRNKSGYTGAFYINRKSGGYYVGKICINDKRITLHKSQDVIECAQAYNIASSLLFGEFAGHKNDVPPPSEKLYRSVYEKCLPYFQQARFATQPVLISASA